MKIINQNNQGSRPQDLRAANCCEYCYQRKAEIFQVTGDYCLQCWQDETHPNV
ncbi:hypothetical protein [Candidatus Nitrososphaera evergladensis]|uniref:hypothetical protein n=1 Tax=Candidatus Nitrososphaera evergladensis TaxID=1459637 RepID=UPI00130DA231|nr:hypothetical protein [Candidatus Nitrososphaera evergladensis]